MICPRCDKKYPHPMTWCPQCQEDMRKPTHYDCTTCNTLYPSTSLACPVCHPKPHVATGTEAAVIQDITDRQHFGIGKYKITVRDNPLTLRQWLQHSYEEKMDDLIYMKRAIEELDKTSHAQTI